MDIIDSLERIIEFSPAFDKRDADPKKNYGIHGVELTFYLKGKRGVIQFKLFTNWMLPHVHEETVNRLISKQYVSGINRLDICCDFDPMPADLGYHSPIPIYEGQTKMSSCQFYAGGCYYDGSTLNAGPVYDTLLREGSEGVWKRLEEYYQSTFNGGD